MDLDALLDAGEPDLPREPVWRSLLKIFAIVLVLMTIGGAVLALVLYLVSIGVFVAWLETWDL